MVLVVLVLVFGGKILFFKPGQEKKNDQSNSKTTPPKKVVKAEPIDSTVWDELNQQVTSIVNEHPDLNISVALTDINTNTSANYGIREAFHGTSTTKVLTAAAYLHDVETGKRTLGETISGATAQTHIRRMINQSNNTSWEVLNNAVSYARLDAYAHSQGVSSFKYYGNLMTASDQALLLTKLYKRELLNEAHTQLLLSFMQNTNNEDMIPVAKPAGATLYHKYGQLDDRLHDSAIIIYKNRPIVLVIYTKGGASDGSNYTSRTKLIQQLASTVISTIYR